jgi:uncharacterized protein with PIN domain
MVALVRRWGTMWDVRQRFERMPECPTCSAQLLRTHRNRLQKIVYSHVFVCPRCGTQVTQRHLRFGGEPLFSRYTRCSRCGTFQVKVVPKRDYIDPVSKSLFSRLQWFLRAPLHKCNACRLQYYDWRPLRPESDR